MLDYMIVGFGLAGASLAHYLEEKSKSFLVFDAGKQASKIAGGLYNPVILNKFTLIWNAQEQLEIAGPFYHALEKKLGAQFQRPLPIHRKFYSVEEQNNWFSATDKPELAPFLNPKLINKHHRILAKYRFGEVRRTGRVDTNILLNAYVDYLDGKKQFRAENFDYTSLQIHSDYVGYKGLKAKQIIFCEGFGATKNPFFNELPLQGNKGEYLIINAPGLKLRTAIKASYFIIPQGNDLYKVGATYERNFENSYPSDWARTTLLRELDTLIDCDYSIVDQVAGIRPTVPDRRPLVGRHSEHANVYYCNGFGSRGVLTAPMVTRQLVEFIEDGKALPEEIDLRRFRQK